MDALYAIGFMLILCYALLTVLGLSLTISQIIFHIVWSIVETSMINVVGADATSVLYVIGVVLYKKVFGCFCEKYFIRFFGVFLYKRFFIIDSIYFFFYDNCCCMLCEKFCPKL
jgi:hypothetical protein